MKTINFFSLFIAIAIVFASCNPKPQGEDVAAEEVKEVEEVAATSVEYAINTETSQVTWIGSKVSGKHDGTIGLSEGSIAVEGDAVVGGKFVIDMNTMANIDLAENPEYQEKLIGHLKSDEFFDVANHPTASFEISSVASFNPEEVIEAKEEYESEFKPASATDFIVEAPTHQISGNLTIRGTTKGITFPAKVEMTEAGIKASAKFNIDRTEWGVKYGEEASAVDKAKDKFVYNTVNVGFSIEASAPAM